MSNVRFLYIAGIHFFRSSPSEVKAAEKKDMKRPAFTPTQIGVADASDTGETVMHFTDAKGNTQLVHLSPQVRTNLVHTLLAGPEVESVPVGHPLFLLDAKNLRLYDDTQGVTCLEVTVVQTPRRAVQFRLPGLLPEALLQLLQGWVKQPPLSGTPN